jgi:hypothetical protein
MKPTHKHSPQATKEKKQKEKRINRAYIITPGKNQ